MTIKLKVVMSEMLRVTLQYCNLYSGNELKLQKFCYNLIFTWNFEIFFPNIMSVDMKPENINEDCLLIIIFIHFVSLFLVQTNDFLRQRQILIDLITILRLLETMGCGLNEFIVDPVLKIFAVRIYFIFQLIFKIHSLTAF